MKYVFPLVCLFLLISPILAQDGTHYAPLYFVMDGYIYSWTESGGIIQLTEEEWASDLSLSPDGTQLAFLRQSREHPTGSGFEIFQELQSPQVCIWTFAEDITDCINEPYYLDLEPEADYEPERVGMIRTHLRWLPDGRLTWVNLLRQEEGRSGIQVYDFDTDTQIHYPVAFTAGDAGMSGIIEYGIWNDTVYIYCCPGEIVKGGGIFYDETGDVVYQLARYHLLEDDVDVAWLVGNITLQNTDTLVAVFSSGEMRAVDATLEPDVYPYSELPGYPYVGLFNENESSLRLRPVPDRSVDITQSGDLYYEILDTSGDVMNEIDFWRWNAELYVAISPDSSRIAYWTREGIMIWEDGAATIIPGTEEARANMAWGFMGWQLDTGQGE